MFIRRAEFRLVQSQRNARGRAKPSCIPMTTRQAFATRQRASVGVDPWHSPVIGSIAKVCWNAAGRPRLSTMRRSAASMNRNSVRHAAHPASRRCNRVAAVWRWPDKQAARLVVNFRTFNLVVAIVFIGSIPWITTTLRQLLPDPPTPHDLGAPQHLDEAALDAANVSLANAARESLHMADLVTPMLDRGLDVLRRNDRLGTTDLHRLDQHLDRLGHAVRAYLVCLSAEILNEADSRRAQEILRFTQKRPRTFVSALASIAAAETSKHRLSRDFQSRSIFDFLQKYRREADIRRTTEVG